jgi:FMN-dependent NADH-azoreductase
VFAFLGIPEIEVVAAEGLLAGPDARKASLAQAEERIDELA